MKALELLKKAGILTKDTKTLVTKFKKIENLTQAMTLLDKQNMLSQENFRSLLKVPRNLERVARAFIRLNQMKILTADTRELAVTSVKPMQLAKTLCCMKRVGLFTKKNYQRLDTAKIDEIGQGIKRLHKGNIASQHNFNLIVSTSDPCNTAEALVMINQEKVLSEKQIKKVLQSPNPCNTAQALVMINQEKVLSEKQIKKVLQSPNPFYVTRVLHQFIHAKILTREKEKWLFSFKDDIYMISNITHHLADEGMLTTENVDIAVKFKLAWCKMSFAIKLMKAKICTEENLKALDQEVHLNYWGALSVVKWTVFNQEVIDKLVLHAKQPHFINIILSLDLLRMFSLEDLEKIHDHPHLQALYEVLIQLKNKKLFVEQLFDLFITNPHLFDLPRLLAEAGADDYLKNFVDAILRLQDSALLTAQNIELWYLSQKNITFRGILSQILALPQLSQALIDEFNQHFVQHPNPLLLSQGINLLTANQITTGQQHLLLAKHPQLQDLVTILERLAARQLLNAAHFLELTSADKVFLVSEEAMTHIWNKIPDDYLTSVTLQKLFMAAAQPHPELTVRQSRDQILSGFNAIQNTHSSSIHRSVSASAQRLMRRYGSGLDYRKVLAALKSALHALEITPKHRAAQRGFENLMRDGRYLDSGSGVYLGQLLALSYLAIQDDSKRMGSVADAQALLVDGLYEIQRGGNIQDDGLDNGNPVDIPICQSGAFNKILEKLNGIHADVEIYFVTHASASAKFPIVAKEEAYAYLRINSTPITEAEYQKAQDMVQKLREDQTIEHIWSIIEPRVKDRIWEEFQDAYAGNIHAEKFIELMSYGSYVGLPEQMDKIHIEMQADRWVSSPRFSPLFFFAEEVDADEPETKRFRW